MPNHPDDGRLLVRIGKVKNLSERVRVAEELVSKVFIDHSNRRRFLAISVGDEAAAYEGDAHDLQIIRLNHVTQSPVHVVFVGGFWLVLEPEKLLVVVAGHGDGAVDKRNRADPGNACNAAIDFMNPGNRTLGRCGRR